MAEEEDADTEWRLLGDRLVAACRRCDDPASPLTDRHWGAWDETWWEGRAPVVLRAFCDGSREAFEAVRTVELLDRAAGCFRSLCRDLAIAIAPETNQARAPAEGCVGVAPAATSGHHR